MCFSVGQCEVGAYYEPGSQFFPRCCGGHSQAFPGVAGRVILPRVIRRLLVLAVLGLASCEGTHNDLGQDTGGGGSGAGGASTTSGGGGVGGTGGEPVEEPDLPDRLTIVHGSPDRDALQLCFLRSPERDDGVMVPADPLSFGEAHVIATPADVLDVTSALEVVVLAGDLDALGDATCSEIVDDVPSGVDALSLGVLPANTFASMRSLALVVTGCFGPEEADGAEAGCGPGYGPDTPTVFPVVAPLSRVPSPSKVGFSVLHAASTFVPLDVRVVPATQDAQPVPIAAQIPRGAALPFPPMTVFSSGTFGAPPGAELRVNVTGNPEETTIDMQEALSNGNQASFDDGDSYVFIAVGASPDAPSGFWSPLTFAAVRADPE